MGRTSSVVVGTLLAGATLTAAASETFYMNVPNVHGEVTARGFEGWIAVTSFDEGFTAVRAPAFGGAGGGRSRFSCQSMQLVKPIDKSSPALTMAVALGRVYQEVDLVAVTTGGELGGQEFLKFALHNVIVSGVTWNGDSTTSARFETVSLSPASVEVTYWPQRPDGTLDAPVTATVTCN
jgi:type VI secretion system Hcp family effector